MLVIRAFRGTKVKLFLYLIKEAQRHEDAGVQRHALTYHVVVSITSRPFYNWQKSLVSTGYGVDGTGSQSWCRRQTPTVQRTATALGLGHWQATTSESTWSLLNSMGPYTHSTYNGSVLFLQDKVFRSRIFKCDYRLFFVSNKPGSPVPLHACSCFAETLLSAFR